MKKYRVVVSEISGAKSASKFAVLKKVAERVMELYIESNSHLKFHIEDADDVEYHGKDGTWDFYHKVRRRKLLTNIIVALSLGVAYSIFFRLETRPIMLATSATFLGVMLNYIFISYRMKKGWYGSFDHECWAIMRGLEKEN